MIRGAASCFALEGGEKVLTQLLWDVVLQVSGHEELEALIVDGLWRNGTEFKTCERGDKVSPNYRRPIRVETNNVGC